ncbi:MAG TPA: hypothetical protein K8V56_03730 [Sporosarcina psychrophila]|uniref:Uncharacterized protein n=1 Tax=Sporosarcina psychrophila TaxID=1476 RepID=A0A921FW41_SPOPS|nr:hypothetical protein [Sporosarcina psychrophila]
MKRLEYLAPEARQKKSGRCTQDATGASGAWSWTLNIADNSNRLHYNGDSIFDL